MKSKQSAATKHGKQKETTQSQADGSTGRPRKGKGMKGNRSKAKHSTAQGREGT